MLISLFEFILDINGKFKVIHFTSSNLLHDFPNDKYMLFSLLKKKEKSYENMGQPDPTHPFCHVYPQPDPFSTCLKYVPFLPGMF